MSGMTILEMQGSFSALTCGPACTLAATMPCQQQQQGRWGPRPRREQHPKLAAAALAAAVISAGCSTPWTSRSRNKAAGWCHVMPALLCTPCALVSVPFQPVFWFFVSQTFLLHDRFRLQMFVRCPLPSPACAMHIPAQMLRLLLLTGLKLFVHCVGFSKNAPWCGCLSRLLYQWRSRCSADQREGYTCARPQRRGEACMAAACAWLLGLPGGKPGKPASCVSLGRAHCVLASDMALEVAAAMAASLALGR